jgi:hypothetical protein
VGWLCSLTDRGPDDWGLYLDGDGKVTEECVDLQASRPEVVEAILTAYFQSHIDHEARVRELIIRRGKGIL